MLRNDFKSLAKKIEREGICIGSSIFGETYKLDNMTYRISDGGYSQAIVVTGTEGRYTYELVVEPDGSESVIQRFKSFK